MRVLIVDDEPAIRALLREILNTSDREYEISEASDGDQALSMVDQVNPELVLLDIVMPRVSGIAVCDHIKRNPKTCRTKVVLVSAKKSDAMVQAGLTAGANDYVCKPFTPQELLARIGRVCRDGED
jgi:DNA-binding response OmpR family regulator